MRRILRRHEGVAAGGSLGHRPVVTGGDSFASRSAVPAADSLGHRSVIADDWRLFAEAADAGDTDPVIVPLCELRKDTSAWLGRSGRLGVHLTPGESVESLADVLPHLTLIAIEFPNIGDGRGFSYGHLLRTRLGFKGELRAVGAGVKQDKIFLLARSGFDSFELPPGENADEALAALRRYDVVYQPGAPVEGIKRQRYF